MNMLPPSLWYKLYAAGESIMVSDHTALNLYDYNNMALKILSSEI